MLLRLAQSSSLLKRLASSRLVLPTLTSLPHPPSPPSFSSSATATMSTPTPTDPATLRRLEPAVVKQILEAPAKETHAILDVRDLDEVAEGALAGRTHLASAAFDDAAQVDALLDGPLAGKEKVIVHCMHSQKRGPACAAKLADRIKAREAEGKGNGKAPEVVVLAGGYHQFVQQFGTEDAKLIVKGLPKEE